MPVPKLVRLVLEGAVNELAGKIKLMLEGVVSERFILPSFRLIPEAKDGALLLFARLRTCCNVESRPSASSLYRWSGTSQDLTLALPSRNRSNKLLQFFAYDGRITIRK